MPSLKVLKRRALVRAGGYIGLLATLALLPPAHGPATPAVTSVGASAEHPAAQK